ncbi:MAG: symmetrical bis(5'-nucleosyl)-tetraphosphatase [Nevskia sp.]|nr:symmetrical bis(5'-nucleosyl)-tetraphosphatase [Nevskia sp.]
MPTYVIGDLQGCYDTLRRLLDRVEFDPDNDRLWLAGDLVNRGPQSLQTLRFVAGLGAAANCVLGNHDLHLLAVASGGRRGKRDTLDDVLKASDRDELLDWLRRRPLLHRFGDGGTALLHAGLPPQWDLQQAAACADEAEEILRSDDYVELFRSMYGDQPDRWSERLNGMMRLRFIINCYTRLRYCSADGRIDFKPKGAPGTQPAGLLPWFAVPGRRSAPNTLIFGHWSTLGQVHWPEYGVYGLDTGAVWGGKLTALRLEDGALSAIDSPRGSEFD